MKYFGNHFALYASPLNPLSASGEGKDVVRGEAVSEAELPGNESIEF
jgi:hypothetical protein